MELCAQLSKLKNLQTVVFHFVQNIRYRPTKDAEMEAILERIAAGELVDWVTACRELPVQTSFEIWTSIRDRRRSMEPGPEGQDPKWWKAFGEAKADYDQRYEKYHGSLTELLTPDSVRKLAEPDEPVSNMEKCPLEGLPPRKKQKTTR